MKRNKKINHSTILKRALAGFMVYLLGAVPTIVFALPQDGQIVSGAGSITQPTAQDMVINENVSMLVAKVESL